MPNQDTILLGLGGPRIQVGAFRLSDLTATGDTIPLPEAMKYGSARSLFPVRILIARDGSVVHLLGKFGQTSSLETTSLRPAAPTIHHAPPIPDRELAEALASIAYTTTNQLVFGDISLDERYIVTNRWAAPELTIIDLQSRTSRIVSVGDGITMTGGVAFNHGWENRGLLALNAMHSIVVYRFHPDGQLEELSRFPIHPLKHFGSNRWKSPIPGNVAWSARGDRLIASTSHGNNDIAILEVGDCGGSIRQVTELAACSDEHNGARAIWTANKRLSPPPDFVPRCTAPELRATATPPPTPQPSRTPVATPLATRASQVALEEMTIVFEGSSDQTARGCGGFTYFDISDGDPHYRSPTYPGLGRVATTLGDYPLMAGPADAAARSYQVFTDTSILLYEPGSAWRRIEISPTMGIPLPYGAMTTVWAGTQMLLTYRDPASGLAVLGLLDRFDPGNPVSAAPLAKVTFERGIPAAVVLEDFSRDNAVQRYGGTAWVVTDVGDVWRVVIRDMEEMTLTGPVASLGAPVVVEGDGLPPAGRVHAELTLDKRFLLVSGWGVGTLSKVDLWDGTVRRIPAGAGLTLTGQIATNRGWENEGLVALHAGDHVVLYALNPRDGALVELARQAIPAPRGETGRPEPGYLAWGSNGLTLIATIDAGEDEFAVFWVRGCGRMLQERYRVAGCPQAGARNRGRAIVTNNGFAIPPPGYLPSCPANVVPATLTASLPTPSTPSPTATSTAEPEPTVTPGRRLIYLPFTFAWR